MHESPSAAATVGPGRRDHEVAELVRRYAEVAAHLPDCAAFVVDRGLRYRLAAGDALRAAGVDASELVGRTVREAMPAEIADAYCGYYACALAGGTFVHEHVAHGRRYVSRGVPLRAPDGEVVAALALSFDITGATGIEAQVRERDAALGAALAELERLYATTPVGLAVFDRELRYRRINRWLADINGASIEAHLGRTVLEMVPDLGARAAQVIGQVLATGESLLEVEFVGETRRQPGERRTFVSNWYPVRDLGDAVVGVGTVVQDVSELRALQSRLRRREAEMARVADNAPVVLGRVDASLRHLSVNRAATGINGRPPEQFAGRTSRELGMPEPAVTAWEAAMRAAFASGEPQQLTVALPQGGGERHFEARLVPERGEDGAIESLLYVGYDVTERDRAEAALREADVRKDEFLAMLAHELRNPLAPLRNALRVLERDALSPQGRSALQVCGRQLHQLTRLVDDLLEVSRVTRGKIALRVERVMLQQVVRTVADGLAPLVAERGQSLAFDVPGAPVWIEADGVRIAQIVENLVSNASKYSDAGGRITVAVAARDDAVTIEVRDTGIGIAPEHLPRLFELFTQVETAIDRSRGGLGIGLALVRRLAELHGGRVSASSDGPGRGATFSVVLPRRARGPGVDEDGSAG